MFAVNRLTPANYPATLKEAAIFIHPDSGLKVGDPMTVLVGVNADGDENINNTAFQLVTTTVQKLGDFNVVTTPAVTINTGDFVLGLRMPYSTANFPFAFDRTATKRRSYSSTDGVNFTLFDTLVPTPGNFGFRARLVRAPKQVVNAGAKLEEEGCKPANQAIDPGEKVTVSFSLRHLGTENIANLNATLLATGGVTEPNPATQSFGAVAAGSPAVAKAFSFRASPSAICGGKLTATLRLQDGATDIGTIAYDFTLGALTPFSVPAIYASQTAPGAAIPDVSTVEFPINITDNGVISDVNVRVRLNHIYNSDVDMFLVAPDGTTVELSTDNNGSNFGNGNNDCTGVFTVFDDQATTPITSGAPPFAGAYKPEGKLSDLNGKATAGAWKLRIADDTSGGAGVFGCFQLEISRRIPLCCQEGCPTVSKIAPDAGPAGRVVTITGANFTGVTGVKFANNLPATFKVESDTQITATAPVGVATGLVSLSKPNCGDVPAGIFTAPLCPIFGSLDPPASVIGSTVRINGRNFTGVNSVKFAGGLAAQFSVTSDSVITVTVPAGATSGPIAIGKPDCAEIATSTFTVTPCPVINAVSPGAAPVGGTVVLNGVGFSGVTAVRFNNNVSAPFTVNSDMQITTSVPSGAVTGPITLVRANCANATSAAFTVQPPPPAPIALTPASQTIALGGSGTITAIIPPQNTTTTIVITSSNSAMVSAPVTLSIPSGASSVSFSVTGAGAGGPVTITAAMPASLGGLSATAGVSVTSRALRVAPASGAPGGTVSVPVELLSQGDENALGFSLNFDPAILGNPQVTLGTDAAGATLSINAALSSQGRVGLALALPAGQKFAAGTRQVARVSFTTAGSVPALSTGVGFGDQPVAREISDTNANLLAAVFNAGIVSFSRGYEADASPRPNGNGNGQVTITDWVQIGRFVAGLDKVDDGGEFQRADCAPRADRGDGRLTVSDWIQASRYATGADPVAGAGGPAAAQTLANGSASAQTRRNPTAMGVLRASIFGTQGRNRLVRLGLDAKGGEQALGFSLLFNPSQSRFVSAELSADLPDLKDATLLVNQSEIAEGRLGLALMLPAGRSLQAGARPLVMLRFEQLDGAAGPRLSLGDQPVAREAVDADARVMSDGLQLELPDARSLVNVSSASFTGTEFASEQLVTAFGTDLAIETASAATTTLPTTLAGTQVRVTDSRGQERLASLLFVSPVQVNYLLPAELATGVATVTVTSGDGHQSSALIQIADAAPSLLTANADGSGVASAVVLRIRADGSQQYEAVAVFDESRQRFVAAPIAPAGDGEQLYLVLFGTGLGRAGGSFTARFSGGGDPLDAPVSYAGRQGELTGVEQINVRLPQALAGRGEIGVELLIAGKASNRVNLLFR
jgi:uncharacterized protein (TIGR03437 family)